MVKKGSIGEAAMNSTNQEDKEWVWNIVLGVQIGCYIMLTAWIIVLHNKLSLLSDARSQITIQQAVPTSPDEFTAQAKYQAKEHGLCQKLETNPQDSELRKELITVYSRQGKISELTRMLDAYADDPEIHLALGKLYIGKNGCLEKAAGHFRKVLELAPDHPQKKHIELRIEELEDRRSAHAH